MMMQIKTGPMDAAVVIPLFAPNEYREQIISRFQAFNDFQSQIQKSKLNDEERKILHASLQSHFKEWLVQTGGFKPILDLVKMIDQE